KTNSDLLCSVQVGYVSTAGYQHEKSQTSFKHRGPSVVFLSVHNPSPKPFQFRISSFRQCSSAKASALRACSLLTAGHLTARLSHQCGQREKGCRTCRAASDSPAPAGQEFCGPRTSLIVP